MPTTKGPIISLLILGFVHIKNNEIKVVVWLKDEHWSVRIDFYGPN